MVERIPITIKKMSSAAPCDNYMCRNKIQYSIGRNHNIRTANTLFCESCLIEVAKALPNEILAHNETVIQLVATIKALEANIEGMMPGNTETIEPPKEIIPEINLTEIGEISGKEEIKPEPTQTVAKKPNAPVKKPISKPNHKSGGGRK